MTRTAGTTRWWAPLTRASSATSATSAAWPPSVLGSTPATDPVSVRELSRAALRADRRAHDGAVPQPVGRGVDPVHEPRLDQPRKHGRRSCGCRAARRRRSVARSLRRRPPRRPPDQGGPHPAARRRKAFRRRSSTRSPTGGTARSSTAATPRPSDSCAVESEREAHGHRRRAPPGRRRDGHRSDRFHPELVGGARRDPHAVRPRAQRDLRHASRPRTRMGRRGAVPDGATDQRRGDGQDPHDRVDAGDPAEPHAERCDVRQLVRPAHEPLRRPPQAGRSKRSPSPTASSAASSATRRPRSPSTA